MGSRRRRMPLTGLLALPDAASFGLGKIFDAAMKVSSRGKGDIFCLCIKAANSSQIIYRRIRLLVLYSSIVDEIVYK